MALYKHSQYLQSSTHEAFDAIYKPGAETPYSGIYRCVGCNSEVASNEGNPLPPQNHHQHTTAQGSIRWQMVVHAQSNRR